jgi:hypothetical protein
MLFISPSLFGKRTILNVISRVTCFRNHPPLPNLHRHPVGNTTAIALDFQYAACIGILDPKSLHADFCSSFPPLELL